MISDDINATITDWTAWASDPQIQRYDIALLKIWIQFEKFIAQLFILYATGQSSEKGYQPELKLQFQSEEQLNVFLREGNRTYIEFPTQIRKLSKHIFSNDPFDLAIFSDANYHEAYNQIVAIRNYIAHESGEARTKYLKMCFGNNETNFKEPNDLLQTRKKKTGLTYYSYYIQSIQEMISVLICPPQ